MSIFEAAREPWPSRALAIFRIVAGLIFITEGTMKVVEFPPAPMALPPFSLFSQLGIGGILEIAGGVLIVIGLFTRPVSFVLSGMMAVAYFQFHAPASFWPTVNLGIPAILYCFFFLYLTYEGAGAWSLDERIGTMKKAAIDASPNRRQAA